MTTFSQPQTYPSEQIAWRRLWWVALLAIAGSALANGIVYLVGSATGAVPQTFLFEPVKEPLMLWQVLLLSFVGALGGVIVFAILGYFTQRPARLFMIISVLILLLSFAMPFGVPGMPAIMMLTLNFMHIVSAVITVGVLVKFGLQS